ncbi:MULTISPECIES: prolipoprotein diacylglyceryl transferase [Streptomyces]|uniref:prolipoprotein diacylglyceryl transferase n=1 Tax=Streptomyces lycopersici TaxID=2974589 RepID=UPI0021D3BBAA|nr:prolipoprotein diacylglyceryl transferase [Streptomyces sp. NEAU-383]
MQLAYLPSPAQGVVHLGPLPLRAYAFCIILGIFVAVWLTRTRWAARGRDRHEVDDIAIWAVPFGIVGGRLYHVITSPDAYFGEGGDPWKALRLWEGGLGIWGAVALGALGAWIGCRRRGISLLDFADAVAPGLALAQAIGRWGNWFNQELYGRPTTLPWGLKIAPANRPGSSPGIATYHPTFLYESLWNIGVALLLLWVGRRFATKQGQTFALYAAAYTVGRFWIEYLRIDEAHTFGGLRLNDWTSIAVFSAAVVVLLRSARRDEGDDSADSGTVSAQPDPEERAAV